ncbi:hypothetical protein O181_066171 [Austropuccinia psidii MF-1]|uniref:Uncharacterized protein n=1 Tax=Austropuccinia psidii MF-1 TaxID=1389203 RepID=A0A9Q3EQE7_9BASI|nr:hypothetical protein [Austropuccinia psidii MF-1]
MLAKSNHDLSESLKSNLGFYWPPYNQHHQSDHQNQNRNRSSHQNQHRASNSNSDDHDDFVNSKKSINLPIKVLKIFRNLSPQYQNLILNLKNQNQNLNHQEIQNLNQILNQIKFALIDSIHILFTNQELDLNTKKFWNLIHSSHLQSQSWWSKLIDHPNQKFKKKSQSISFNQNIVIDHPIAITFIPCHPLQPSIPFQFHPLAQKKFINLNQIPFNRALSIGFQDTPHSIHHINFNRKNPYPFINLSSHVNTLGIIWIEKPSPTNSNRILFQKTCPDLDLTLLIWPQFNQKFFKLYPNSLPEPPKIPVYHHQIVQLCDGDRLILFTSNYKSHRVHISLQISLKFHWASENHLVELNSINSTNYNSLNHHNHLSQKNLKWSENYLQWPNPCERYPHYLKQPITYAQFMFEPQHDQFINSLEKNQLHQSHSQDIQSHQSQNSKLSHSSTLNDSNQTQLDLEKIHTNHQTNSNENITHQSNLNTKSSKVPLRRTSTRKTNKQKLDHSNPIDHQNHHLPSSTTKSLLPFKRKSSCLSHIDHQSTSLSDHHPSSQTKISVNTKDIDIDITYQPHKKDQIQINKKITPDIHLQTTTTRRSTRRKANS